MSDLYGDEIIDYFGEDLFFRFNQTFQYFFDASSDIETVFEEIGID